MQVIDLDSLQGGALDAEVRVALRGELKDARRAARPVVIVGSPGSWNHGRAADDARSAQRELHSLVLAVIGHPAPVVALVSGETTGFGLALAAAADVRLATADAVLRVAADAAVLETGAYRLLCLLLGRAQANDLVYIGRSLTAREAATIGLVSAADATTADAAAMADSLSTPGAAAVKRASTAALVSQLAEQLEYDAWLAMAAAGETP